MGTELPVNLADLVETVARLGGTVARRRDQARRAILEFAPALRTEQPRAICAEALRTAFVCCDVYLFGCRFHTAFENMGRVEFMWRLDHEADSTETRLEVWIEEIREVPPAEMALLGPSTNEEHWFELVVSTRRLANALKISPLMFAGRRCADIPDALAAAMEHLMLLAAARISVDTPEEASAVFVRLKRALGRPS